MPRKEGRKRVELLLTEEQYALLIQTAGGKGKIAEYVRRVLGLDIPHFNDTAIPGIGTYLRGTGDVAQFLDSLNDQEHDDFLESLEG